MIDQGTPMSSKAADQWYLIRTKPAKERWVRDQLSARLPEVFLPMLKARVPRWGRMAMSVAPLFSGTATSSRGSISQTDYFEIKYLAGVTGLVSAGPDPIVVPDAIISEIRARGINDVVEIHEVPFDSGQSSARGRGSLSRLRGDLRALSVQHRASGHPCSTRWTAPVRASYYRRRRSRNIPDPTRLRTSIRREAKS